MDVKNNPIIKAEFHPDLNGDLIPGICAAGICIGSSGQELLKKIGPIEWFDLKEAHNQTKHNDYWIGIDRTTDFDMNSSIMKILSYKNNVIRVLFNTDNDIICAIYVSRSYRGKFYNLTIGSDYALLCEKFTLGLENEDDMTFIKRYPNFYKSKSSTIRNDQLDEYYYEDPFDSPADNSSSYSYPQLSDELAVEGISFGVASYAEPDGKSSPYYIDTILISNWSLEALPAGFFNK